MDDFWNPNTWPEDPPERRLYMDDYSNQFVRVSREDFAWATQWRWTLKVSSTKKNKFYACRRSGSCSIYLHVEIMRRAQPRKPWENAMTHHSDRDTFNNTRENLAWVTPSMNRRNVVEDGQGRLL